MTNLMKRFLTGVVLIFGIWLSVIWSCYSFFTLVVLINIIGLREFYRLFESASPMITYGMIVSLVLLFSFIIAELNYFDWEILLINIPSVFILFLIALYSRSEKVISGLAFTFMGILYVSIPLVFLLLTAFNPFWKGVYVPTVILGLFIIVWSNDTGAFIFGKILGSNHLFARISPNKTWEGSFGGAICSLLAAFVSSLFFTILSLSDWMIISLIVIVTGTYGDLIKSMMKRSVNVKDSGSILPGHGGILDRFDSLMGSVPFVFCYLILFFE